MKNTMIVTAALLLTAGGEAMGRGFGRVGGFSAGGYRGGFASGGYRAGGYSTPYRGAAGYERGGSYTTARGGTVQAGAVGGARYNPYGAAAGGARGVRVTTPGGETYSRAQAGGVRSGVGGVSGGRAGYASGPARTVAGGYRAGAAVGPYGGVHAGYAGGVSVRGGGAAVVGHRSYYMSPYHMVARGADVRAVGYSAYGRGWYAGHPAAWRPGRWYAGSFWTVPTFVGLAPWVGYAPTALPVDYDYGSSVVFNDNRVYVNGSPTVTTDEYAEQAQTVADEGRAAKPADDEEFRALGSFGMIEGDETTAQNIFQLGINKAGVVRGNYYNALTDSTVPVTGKLDQKSQRVCWTAGARKDVVFEAGLSNLTKEQTTAVIHFGKEKTVQMILVRLDKPSDEK